MTKFPTSAYSSLIFGIPGIPSALNSPMRVCLNSSYASLPSFFMYLAIKHLYIDNITFGLYPQLAAAFDTTAARVERAMRHLVEVTWTRGDVDVLNRYFGNTVSPDKGKPTNGEFIARITNIVKLRMKEAA